MSKKFCSIRSSAVKLPEAMMVGIDINIEIRAASFLVKPAHKAPVIVIPDREVPGIRAIACHIPNLIASVHVKVSIFRLRTAR